MCGIAGILRIHGAGGAPPTQGIPDEWLDVLDAGVRHRGPDGSGRFRDRGRRRDGSIADVALVHRRLSILDHAGGAQPMVSRDRESGGRVAVVFNGCIYNHRDLRRELTALGCEFASDHSDTEVLIHGWRRWGAAGLCERVSDMFAFALWDSERGELILARDQFGQKPLFWATLPGDGSGGCWAFASTAAALYPLMRASGSPPTALPERVAAWVRYGAWIDPPISGMKQVRPGHLVDFADGRPRELAFIPGAGHDDGRGAHRAVDLTPERADRALRTAVHQRLEADVELGCFLSGGVDSSLVACYAREIRPELATFTVRMPDPRFDESAHAAAVAGVLGTRHLTLDCNPKPAQDLVSLITNLGLPFGDSSLLPAHWLSRAVRGAATVALSGDGGDELFAGYERYQAVASFGSLARLAASLWPFGADAEPKSRRSRAARLADACRHGGYCDLVSIFPESMLTGLGLGAFALGTRLRHGCESNRRPGLGTVEEAIACDLTHYLPDDLMLKSDTASMAAALEVRAPFLDRALVELATSARVESLMPGGERKGLLRAVARRYLPAGVVDRPKQGFAIPIGEWFRTDVGGLRTLLNDMLGGADPFPAHLLGVTMNRRYVDLLVNEHMASRRDHAQRLYTLLALAIWCRSVLRS